MVCSLATTAADNIVSKLLSDDCGASEDPSVEDISLVGFTSLFTHGPTLGFSPCEGSFEHLDHFLLVGLLLLGCALVYGSGCQCHESED